MLDLRKNTPPYHDLELLQITTCLIISIITLDLRLIDET
jgi:hypothetical protein